MIKKNAASRLLERLRREEEGCSTPFSMSSRVKLFLGEGPHFSSTAFPEVGTVGTVGTTKENNDLVPNLWSEQRSERSEQGVAAPQSAAALPSPAADELQEVPRGAGDDDVEDWGLVPQSIPQAVMVAGLLAASRIRPRAEPLPPVDDEGAAWALGVAQLQRMPPLPGFGAVRWASVVGDCARLLARNGPDLRCLGWGVEDAFGVHPDAPGDAVHCYGLGLLLNGGNVVDLTEQAAAIELPNGVRQTFRRSVRTGAVPVWTVRRAPAAVPIEKARR